MFTRQRLTDCFLFVLLACGIAFAQEKPSVKRSSTSVPITVSASGALVRFTAVGAVERMRLEVFDTTGSTVFDTGFLAGNIRDWKLKGAHGQLLPDATYLCVVTIRELTGRMSLKQGSVVLAGGQAALALEGVEPEAMGADRTAASRVAPDEALAARSAEESASMTVVAHDGEDGQLTSTSGALTFRTGDVFSGKEKERMRLTEDGQLGIGTKDPQTTLDVAGTVRASKGVAFADGTVLTSATGRAQKMNASGEPEPLVAGTGTQGKLAKWTDNAGTLGDSVVTELNNNIGVGTATPNSKLHVVGALELGAAAGNGVNPSILNPNNLSNFAQVRFYPASGTNVNTSFTVVPRGTGQPNNRAQFSILRTDAIADPNNAEFAAFRARDTDFVFGTGKKGTGQNRPLMLSAGFLTDNTTNNNQLVLATDGNVGVGMNAPTAKLHVSGNVNFTGLRTEANAYSPNVIGGFSGNTVTAGVFAATIAGGGQSGNLNRVTDNYGTVGGGGRNTAGDESSVEALYTTVSGGFLNTASKRSSTVGGGTNNVASGHGSTISGGEQNTANGNYAAIGGGYSNTASLFYSTVPGGVLNTASGSYSFAAGLRAQALHQGSFVWADSSLSPGFFSSTAANQFLVNATGGVGINTNAPTAALHVVGAGRFTGNLTVGGTLTATLPSGSTSYIQNQTAATQAAGFKVNGNGTLGGTLSANIVNATTQYNIAGNRVLSVDGSNNLVAGEGAGTFNTGSNNSFFGTNAGRGSSGMSTGGSNAFFGRDAGLFNTTGGFNSFFGTDAGEANTTGGGNIFVGDSSGLKNTGGDENTFVGSGAGLENLTGARNVFVGKAAGLSNTSENDNTFVGSFSNGAAGIINATAVGHRAKVTQSNSLVLGSINGQNGASANTHVGIGTTAPLTQLHIRKDTNDALGPVITLTHGTGGTNAGAAIDFNGYDTGNNPPTARILSEDDGFSSSDLTFLTKQPGAPGNPLIERLIITDTGISIGIPSNPSNTINHGNLTVNGNLSASGNVCATNVPCASDARLKQGITNLSYGLSHLLRLRPVSWRWKAQPEGELQLGLVAQEVAPVLPELVLHGGAESKPLGLNYMGLLPVVIKAVQEQQAEIERQQSVIKAQRDQLRAEQSQIASLEARLAALERANRRPHRRARRAPHANAGRNQENSP